MWASEGATTCLLAFGQSGGAPRSASESRVALCAGAAEATPFLVADADSGQVLIQNEATEVWYPASLTKLMTVYVALDAVRAGKLTMDTPLVMSARAARMPPSKMGFRPGTEVTLDNALKMLMVKSPNDVAVMVAEGVSGSVEAFADDMNAEAQRLGLQESHFVNPNGLHNPDHVSSARDMAMIARALLRDFPDHADLYGIGALQLGNQIITNHNGLLGRYPGADGMKTGFTCPAGFNVVATANHSGRRLIVVVLGSPSAKLRTQEAADLFDRGFAMSGGSGTLEVAAVRRRRSQEHARGRLPAPERRGDRRSRGRKRGRSRSDYAQGRGGAVAAAAASAAPYHTEISDERPHFDPVPGLHRARRRLEGPGSRREAHACCDCGAAGGRQGLFCRKDECDRRPGFAERGAKRADGSQGSGSNAARDPASSEAGEARRSEQGAGETGG